MKGSQAHFARKLAILAALLAVLGALLYRELGPGPDEDALRRQAFEEIYARAEWGEGEHGKGWSGPGSTMESTRLYRVFLQDFLASHGIRTVVDAGCGDWEFSKAIDWTGIEYLGVDIVPALIAGNRRRYGAPNVRFAVADIVRDALPPADLLIVKDVLQHLSDADIGRFLKQLPRYRHVLIVNDVDPVTLSAPPVDIGPGGYRRIDITRSPHSVPGTKVLAWNLGPHSKVVVHLRNQTPPAR